MSKTVFLLSCLLAAAQAFGVDARKYAAMSLLGDQIDVVHARMQTGSAVAPRNLHETVPMPDAMFDKTALRAVDRSVARHHPGRQVMLLLANDPSLYALQEHILEADGAVSPLLQPIKAITDPREVTHLILVTKYRHEALLRLRTSSVGSGKLTGLGFYLDQTTRTSRGDTLERGVGIIAPYAYFRISIVDMNTLKVLREDTGLASLARSAARAPDGVDPWQALDNPSKVRMLEGLLEAEIERILPPLLAE